MVCTIILLVADWTLFCDFTRKQLPARLAIFVAQLGRKFRLFSLTLQRYNLFIAVYESRANIFLVFLRKRQANLLRVAVLQFSKGFSHTLKILLYLYINIELIFDYHRIYFGTATLQQPQRTTRLALGSGTGKPPLAGVWH
jgi:hypothetical protein